jgi:glycosyltransferase involved in cell wall biosynthesis
MSILNTAKRISHISICDPVCVQRFGHNLAAMHRYARFFRQSNIQVSTYAGKSLERGKEQLSNAIDPEEAFSHYYSRFIPINRYHAEDAGQSIATLSSKEAHELCKKTSLSDLRLILEKTACHDKPAIFFPSVDYYSLLSLVQLAREGRLSSTTLFIRWIGVMENCCYHLTEGKNPFALANELTSLLGQSSHQGGAIHSCESSNLARELEKSIGKSVTVTPTLVEEPKLEQARQDPFTICFPGSPRIDKGFEKIASILERLESTLPTLEYRAIIQCLPSNELRAHYNLLRAVLHNPHVQCYPASVSQETLTGYIERSSLLVLPYDKTTYRYRSSAMMAEAACYCRQIVASSDCGFSDQVKSLGIGRICENVDQIAQAISEYSSMPPNDLGILAESARKRYLSFSLDSYTKFFCLN